MLRTGQDRTLLKQHTTAAAKAVKFLPTFSIQAGAIYSFMCPPLVN